MKLYESADVPFSGPIDHRYRCDIGAQFVCHTAYARIVSFIVATGNSRISNNRSSHLRLIEVSLKRNTDDRNESGIEDDEQMLCNLDKDIAYAKLLRMGNQSSSIAVLGSSDLWGKLP